jgi:hypothetical protein
MSSADNIILRSARQQDLPAIVGPLADDPLGQQRERPDDPPPDSYPSGLESHVGMRMALSSLRNRP